LQARVREAGRRHAATGRAEEGCARCQRDIGSKAGPRKTYARSNIRLISVSAQTIASFGVAAFVTTFANMLGMT
jgi:hypothetical protein